MNVNADEMAGALAAAHLLLLSDVEGIQVESTWQSEIHRDAGEARVAAGDVTRGMIPKLCAAGTAVAVRVGEVRIDGFGGGSLEEVHGTRVLGHPEIDFGRGARPEAVAHG